MHVQVQNRCFVQTAVVNASGPRGARPARLLIDGGSDVSFIRTSLAEELGLDTVGHGTFACIGFKERVEEARQYDQVTVGLTGLQTGEADLTFWKTDQLCAPVGLKPTDVMSLPPGVQLADDLRDGPVDLLVGCDQLYKIVLWNQMEVCPGLRLVETVFGYTLHGQAQGEQPSAQRRAYRCQLADAEQMWTLDAVGVASEETAEKTAPEPNWSEEDDRYKMGLLWKSDCRPASNLQSAQARTRRLIERMGPEEFHQYDRHLEKLKEDGVVEDSPPNTDDPNTAFYLPHRGLNRNGKLRVVFDDSAPDGTGRSLNEYLEPGDNLLRRLPAVVLSFRTDRVGCQADFRSAFHQIALEEPDRRFVQFLWQDQQLRFRRVPFGITCSPYMLLRSISCHVRKYASLYPDLMQVERALYMDDICPTFCTRDDAVAGMEQISSVFGDAKMELHKTRMTGDVSDDVTVLGLVWRTETDELAVTVPQMSCPSTRSELLSTVARPFDPLGLLTPWLVRGKILFQRSWTKELTWNEPLPAGLQEEVDIWWRESTSKAVWFPRSALTSDTDSEPEFNVFCDASQSAYCAAVYVTQGGESRLLIAKARLAPLKPALTIPRLELMAALIGCRLMKFVTESLNLTEPRVTYWTDAMDVLYWLTGKRQLRVFVQNRVTSILQLSRFDQWRHVRGEDNPADLGTRGITVAALEKCDVWWHGPHFLRQGAVALPPELPPVIDELELSPLAERELRKVKTPPGVVLQPPGAVLQPPGADSEEPSGAAEAGGERPARVSIRVTQCVQSSPFDITTCSTLAMAVNRLAWVNRFVSNSRLPKIDRAVGPLTPEEKRRSLRYWIREAQVRVFPGELEAVSSGRLLPAGSALQKLRPELSEDGLLESALRSGERRVPILPELSHISTLIIDDAHRLCFHQGTRVTLSLLTAEYMVRRRAVRRVVDTCHRCRRYKGLPYRSPEGALPTFRTQPSRPFSKVGMDYLGPLFVSDHNKVWALLITCATSRAVHLELVNSQNTADLLMALRRFFAIRGTPSIIYSDNARTFHALLSHLPRCVTWRYIPEAAPWWGGFWERLVGVTKKALRTTLHLTHLSFEELAVCLYELAFMINLRPLTESDGEDLLTPAHFLFGVTSIDGVVCPSLIECSVSRAWRHRRRVCDHLNRRWRTEYLSALRCWSASPRGRPSRLPDVGDVVLVHNEGPRGRWPLARVTALLPGADGHPRAAVICLRGRTTRRPLSRLYALEAVE